MSALLILAAAASVGTACSDDLPPFDWVECVEKEQERLLNHRLDNAVVNRARDCWEKYQRTKCGGEWSFFSMTNGVEKRHDWNMSAASCAKRIQQSSIVSPDKTFFCRKQEGILPDYL